MPAKLNVHLRVFPRDASGFHSLRSWFRVIRFNDWFNSIARADVEDELCIIQGLEVPTDRSNLVLRAFDAIREAGIDLPPIRIRMTKSIPPGSGLGGGSSNAAMALVAAKRFADVSDDLIRKLAPTLGSDVPFFVSHLLDHTQQATVTGRGEIVEPIIARQRHSVLLILPDLHLSTPAVFKTFDELPPPADDGTPDFAEWSWLSSEELLPQLRNDLEPAAFVIEPSLGKLRSDCEKKLGRPVRMSGSGSTLFTLYDSDDEAKVASKQLDTVRSRVA
ncbi:MAG: hypothetical protein AAF561_13540 [Planctomycetota bacterium]